jgi:trk system potassium uptake protein TrkH
MGNPLKKLRPSAISVLGFAAVILTGAVLLMLPAASVRGGLAPVDALFTSTSATCVTGLAVADTGRELTFFGQAVLLLLIQVGGLGIMTLSTAILLAAGRSLSLMDMTLIRDTYTHSGDRKLYALLMDVIRFTLIIEALGAALLFLRFLPGQPVGRALWLAVFHAVSAFCNAGFSLYSDNLMGFRGDWLVNLTVCALIICGGIGFLVLTELRRAFPFGTRSWSRFSLHLKLVVSTTGWLLAGGTLAILVLEWRNTLLDLPLDERLLASFFQAVTPRTAGFNTLDYARLTNETLFLTILLMFVGAASGSCAGGVKVGSLATLVALSVSRLKGFERPHLFRRSIAPISVSKAVNLVLVSATLCGAATMALLASELQAVSHEATRGKFLELLFETVSAFGTVGLSMGVTPTLSHVGKLVLVAVMFIGRLGPLVIVEIMSRQRPRRYYQAEERIMIG